MPVGMAETWYELATPEHFWMYWRFSLLRHLLENGGVRKGRGIDIGCGQGMLFLGFGEAVARPVCC